MIQRFGLLPIPIGQLEMPMLFIQGGEELFGLSDSQWNGLVTMFFAKYVRGARAAAARQGAEHADSSKR
jgi:hypothetical protein